MYGCFLPKVFSGVSHCKPLAFGDVSYVIDTLSSPLVLVGNSMVNFEPMSFTVSVTQYVTGIFPPSVTTFTSLIAKSLTSSNCLWKQYKINDDKSPNQIHESKQKRKKHLKIEAKKPHQKKNKIRWLKKKHWNLSCMWFTSNSNNNNQKKTCWKQKHSLLIWKRKKRYQYPCLAHTHNAFNFLGNDVKV